MNISLNVGVGMLITLIEIKSDTVFYASRNYQGEGVIIVWGERGR